MIPILLNNAVPLSELVNDNTNGLGRLSDCISCKCTEERNGKYTLVFEYPVTGAHYMNLSVNGIIKAKASDHAGNQLFRINHISREMDGTVEVTCNHISYDLAKTSVAPFTATGITDALSKLKANMTGGSAFSFSTDISNVTSKFANKIPQSARAILGGQDGSLLDIYGGEYDFDNLTVKLLSSRGNNRGMIIKYGKNLVDLKQEESLSDFYTAVMPYVKLSDDTVITGDLQTIVSVPDDNVKILNLDVSAKFDNIDNNKPTASDIDAKAQKYIKANSLTTPKVSLKVSAIDLSKTVEYRLKQAEQIDLCDTVTVLFEKLNIAATAKVNSITYNVLTEMNDSYEIGNAKSTLASTIAGMSGTISQAERNAVSTSAGLVASMTALILGGLGGHMIVGTNADGQPNELYFMDTADKSTAKYVLRENLNGIGFSNTGINGPFTTAWTIDGKFNAEFINGLTIIGNAIKGASITGSTITWDDGSGHTVTAQAGAVKNSSVSSGGVTFTGGGFSAQCDMAELKSKTSDGTQYAQVETYLYNGKPFAAMHNETYSSTDPHLAYVITNDKLASMSASVIDKVSYINTTPTCTYIGSIDTSSSSSKKSSVNVTPEKVDITTTGNVNIQPDGKLSLLTTDDIQISANGTTSIKGNDTVAVGAGKNVVLGTISAPTKINGSTVIVNMAGQQLVQPDENNSKLLDYYNGYSYGLPVVAYSGGSSDGNHSIGLMWTGSDLVVQVDKTAVGTVQFKS